MSGQPAKGEMQLSFRDVVYHIFRFRRPALAAMVLVVAGGVALTLGTERQYEAKAKLLLDMNTKDLSLIRADNPAVRLNLEEMLFTEVEALKSWRRTKPVLDSLRTRGVAIPAGAELEPLVLSALPIRKSSFIEVGLRGSTPEFAAAYLNEALRQYAQLRNKVQDGNEQLSHYSKSLEEYEDTIRVQEALLADFRKRHDIVLIEEQVRSELSALETARTDLTRLEREVRQRRADLAALERLRKGFRTELITREVLERFPELRWNVEELKSLQKDLDAKLRVFRDDQEDVVRLKGRVAEQEQALALVLDTQLEFARQDLRLREEDMRDALAGRHKGEGRLGELSGVEREYKQRVASLQELQDLRTTLVRKIQEMKLQSLQNGAFRLDIVGEATASPKPVQPNVLYNTLLTLFMALGLGILIPLYKWKVDDTVVTEADAERITGLPSLGGIREER